MFYGAKNQKLKFQNTDMDYISFGYGEKPLVLIPGVGDGVKTVRGMAFTFALTYKQFAKRYKVYAFSRKNLLEEGCTTRDMARDLAAAMKELGLEKAHVVGVSQGGMIAQYLAIDYPELVDKLVISVSLARPNETIRGVVNSWIELVKAGDFKGLMIDTAEKSYSEAYLKKYRRLYPFMGIILGKPKDFGRFIIQANSCITHDACGELNKIKCPALIIGGGRDKIVGVEGATELANGIADSELVIYDELGHGAYEEAKDFSDRIMRFLS